MDLNEKIKNYVIVLKKMLDYLKNSRTSSVIFNDSPSCEIQKDLKGIY